MAKAVWNGAVLAESNWCIELEGNLYFPPDSLNPLFFQRSKSHTACAWKGVASYYDLVVEGKTNRDAAWYYPVPLERAQHIKNYVAFWKGVQVKK